MIEIADSQRLSYTMMTHEDSELFYQLDQDVEVMRYINGGIASSRQDIEQQFIPRLEKYHDPQKGWGMWKVQLKPEKTFIGWILIRPVGFFEGHPQYQNLEIGWRFMRKSWGKGYATEAAQQVINALRTQAGIHHFSAVALEDNLGSINIMKKLGMQLVKEEAVPDTKDSFNGMNVVWYEQKYPQK